MGQRQHRHLARLRPRRPARSVPRRLLARTTSISGSSTTRGSCRRASSTRTTAAASICSATSATDLRGRQRAGRARAHAAGRSPRSPPTCAAPAIPDLFLANDYGVSELFTNEGGRVPRGRPRRRRRLRAEERHERVGRRHLQPGRFAIYVTNISEEGMLVQGNNLWVPTGARGGAAASTRTWRAPGRRARRLELGRAVRRSQQRRHPRPLSRQRLRLGDRAEQLLVRLLEDRRRQQLVISRRAQLAGDGRPQPGRLPAEARVDQRRRRAVHRRRPGGRRHRPLRRPGGRARRLGEPRRARRRRRQPARPAAALPERGRAGPRTGSSSSSRAAADRIRPPAAAATAARSARGSRCTGTASSRCRRCRAERLLRAEPAPAALRPGHGAAVDACHPLAVGQDAGTVDSHEPNSVHTIKEPA